MESGGEYQCARCRVAFLPFRRGVPCPSCGVPAGTESPIIPAVLRTYEENLRRHGSGVPPSIRVVSLWDDYLYRGLFFLKAIDGRRPRESEEAVLTRSLSTVDGSKGTGWRGYLEDFYRAVLRARRGPAPDWRHKASEREK